LTGRHDCVRGDGSKEASPPEHAGRHSHLTQRRGADPAALRPRGGHVHELVLELGEAACLVDLCQLSVDVEPLLISSTSRIGDDSAAIHCSICARRFSRLARLRAGTFGARSTVR
jgi:hypothetical protein